VFKGEHVRQPEVEVLRCRELRISAERSFEMYADGDPIAALPVTVRALPGAIKVLVPPAGRLTRPPFSEPEWRAEA
jgi:diacylglycerol kinase family enzyme